MQKKGNTLLVILLIVASFAAGYFFFKTKSLEEGATLGTAQQNQPQNDTEAKFKKPTLDEHWNGQKNVRFVWIEYSDLECPFCQRIHPDLTKLLNVYSGEIAWVLRHFPLPIHPKAQKLAEATECAADLGGNEDFWGMLNLIFAKMPSLELSELPALALQIGLDQTKFSECLDSGKFEKKVKDQLAEGSNAGVQGTPTNIIYDLKTGTMTNVEGGALPYED